MVYFLVPHTDEKKFRSSSIENCVTQRHWSDGQVQRIFNCALRHKGTRSLFHNETPHERSGSNSAWYWIEKTAASPKIGRPLQNLPRTLHGGFVAVVPFTVSVQGEPPRAFRDGTGICK
jgi:hypothetical protein